MKKYLIIIIVIILILTIGFTTYYMFQSESKNKNNIKNSISKENNKILVVYFSAQNHTKNIAEKIANNLNADIFEIIPKEKYTEEDLDWTNENSRVSKEHNNENLRNIELQNNKAVNWDNYNTILIGYPIWWGIAAWPVNTFIKTNDFTNKTVIPFCTSASSEIGNSSKNLEKLANSGIWLDGIRFSSTASDNDIKNWTDSIIK